MDYNEPHLVLNEKMHHIQWIEWPTVALMIISSDQNWQRLG